MSETATASSDTRQVITDRADNADNEADKKAEPDYEEIICILNAEIRILDLAIQKIEKDDPRVDALTRQRDELINERRMVRLSEISRPGLAPKDEMFMF
ncbi:hypothetical protein ISF_02278 [Cordyceps fumosorosea ARSEF 2679]|uniref:Uncharacterized protein n=1 Tax=Cordyceps fumosorosea (strain ARSEF 2679) TaxID=1081104 RepID=A0A162LGK6_CORFA|nr:hypothetical protein ISF_02278 [Cordyceps fumosorosea ARSEF 2679]OAA70304.1 hypothetical protein ISF_02278 [Cordyceps fumosorosea ARSEF 2679]